MQLRKTRGSRIVHLVLPKAYFKQLLWRLTPPPLPKKTKYDLTGVECYKYDFAGMECYKYDLVPMDWYKYDGLWIVTNMTWCVWTVINRPGLWIVTNMT